MITYSVARDAGLKTYFTGEPCKHGHIADRYVVDKACVQCRRNRDGGAEYDRRIDMADQLESYAKNKMLAGVRVSPSELLDYARTGKLPFRILNEGGYLAPGLDEQMANYYVREGQHKGGRIRWGIYNREDGSCIAVFMPGFPRAVATIKELYDACFENRKYTPGRPERLSRGKLRDVPAGKRMHVSPSGLARNIVPTLAAARGAEP